MDMSLMQILTFVIVLDTPRIPSKKGFLCLGVQLDKGMKVES
jgi:hypothetical protein